MTADELVVQDVFHVAGIEQGVIDAVDLGIDFGVLNSFRHVFYADNLTALPGNEVGNGARAGIEVVDQFVACQSGKLTGNTIQMVGLFGICLVEGLRANLELQVFHQFKDMVAALEGLDLLIADGVVTLLVV